MLSLTQLLRTAEIALRISSPPVPLEVDVACGILRGRRFGSPRGRLILAIPGLGTSSRSFDFLGQRLGRPPQQLVALDLRGRGRSSRTSPGTYGWRRHAGDVLGAAAQLQEAPCDLIGHSMGAFVAMQAVALAPQGVRRLVLIDGVGSPDVMALVTILAVHRWLSRARSSDGYAHVMREAGLVDPWYDRWDQYFRDELVWVDGRLRSQTDPWAVAEDVAHAGWRSPRALWDCLAGPVLLVRATRPVSRLGGFMVPSAERAAFVRAVPHAEVVDVDANHLGLLTHPDAAAAISRFLS
jgi:pimeloyl-ACP methyl ester carboxylesterase